MSDSLFFEVGERVWHAATGPGSPGTVLAVYPGVPGASKETARVAWDGEERDDELDVHPTTVLRKV